MPSYYLGLDSSTQSLTAVLIEVTPLIEATPSSSSRRASSSRRVVLESSLRFDDLPEFGTQSGVLPRADDSLVVHSNPRVWIEALDRVMGDVSAAGFDLGSLRAISGSGQQHGSVYLAAPADEAFAGVRADGRLVDQVDGWFARDTAPIWMDSSTHAQCDAIEAQLGGYEELARLTGSRAFERFTGPQIRKFYELEPEAYARTKRIHLVSSFMASLLAGRDAAIDPGDGAGMNLMDLAAKQWAPRALDATAPGLAERLPELRESWHVNGGLASYWREKYGFAETTRVVSWSGDNPCSLIGVGLVEEGRVAISLGTSDTLFGFMPEARVDPNAEGHAFGSPTGDYMSLLCFKNGSLARERIRSEYGLDWEQFSSLLRDTEPGNGGSILLPWFEAEITPNVLERGVRRYALDASDAAANVRAVIEAQMLSMAVHSDWMGVDFRTVHATGGAAANREILQVMADVHGADVYQFPVKNSAALGAALRAFHADQLASGTEIRWTEVIREFAEPLLESRITPRADAHARYRELASLYSACEKHALGVGADPSPRLAAFAN